MRVALLDYEAGNLRSVATALAELGTQTYIVSSPVHLYKADALIFPGVGEAASAMDDLKKRGFVSAIRHFSASGGAVLGICVGAQLLFGHSEESNTVGLGLLEGDVRRLPSATALGERLKVPQIGWNPVRYRSGNPLFFGISQESAFYFVHSYYLNPHYRHTAIAWSNYGVHFAAAVCEQKIWGVQFHPEKSGRCGLQVLANFLRCAVA